MWDQVPSSDWTVEAAREIWQKSGYQTTISPASIQDIIEKHCLFKRDTAYMVVPAQEVDRDTNPKV